MGQERPSRVKDAYRRAGVAHVYIPDFIAKLDIGLDLIVEVKYQVTHDAEIKRAAAKRWVDAVNLSGKYGLWGYEMVTKPPELSKLLDTLCMAQRERVLEM